MPPSGLTASARQIRVFVSSTFRDMQAERDHLVKNVFPQLRRLCESRGVTWGEVDLRWGVTDEAAAEGKVLDVCLEEIHRCRPYFIGLLGERYGWIPDAVSAELIEREPWLAEHLNHSVTELEILHGVLHNPEMAEHTFFYFRDPAYVESIPPDRRTDFLSENAQSAQKLQQLKETIRSSGLPVREDYQGPESLGELVLQDLSEVIDSLFPEDSLPDPLDREANEHEVYAQSLARAYIGRATSFRRLDEFANGSGPPLVVLGESGAGKSALLANWAYRYREQYPEDVVLIHFIGATSQSAGCDAMLRRLMGELQRRLEIDVAIPDDNAQLREAFEAHLGVAAGACERQDRRLVIVLDALNQLEDRDAAPDLVWLPHDFHGARILLSTLPGRALQELQRRDYPTMSVEAIDADERRRVVTEYLGLYRKSLSPQRIERIVEAPQTGNPLFLRTMLDELRVFGSHEALDARITYYLSANRLPDLYELVLDRYEEDFDLRVVSDAMSLLWAARLGLSEAELCDLLGDGGQPLPRARWSPLFLAAEQSLVNRAGLLNFSHSYLRDAVQERYLPTEEQRGSAHLRLADYFQQRLVQQAEQNDEIGQHSLDELLWQLAEASQWQRLYDLLSNIRVLVPWLNLMEDDVRTCWARIEESSTLRLADACAGFAQQELDVDPRGAQRILWLLSHAGHPDEAIGVQESIVAHYRKHGSPAELADELRSLAWQLSGRASRTGRSDLFDRALQLLAESGQLCQQTQDWEGQIETLLSHADVLERQDKYRQALEVFEHAEALCRQRGDNWRLAKALREQARICCKLGDRQRATMVARQEEPISRALDDPQEWIRSLEFQAAIARNCGQYETALRHTREGHRLRKQSSTRYMQIFGFIDEAMTLMELGQLEDALRICCEQEQACRQVGFHGLLSQVLYCIGDIERLLGHVERALECYREKERLHRDMGDLWGIRFAIGLQACAYRQEGNFENALERYQAEEAVCRQLSDSAALIDALASQAKTLSQMGRGEEALQASLQGLQVAEQVSDQATVFDALGSHALILHQLARYEEAAQSHRRRMEIALRTDDDSRRVEALGDYSFELRMLDQFDEALAAAEEAVNVARRAASSDTLDRALSDLAYVLGLAGRLDDALAAHGEREDHARELDDPEKTIEALTAQADVLLSAERPSEALEKSRVACDLARQSSPSHETAAGISRFGDCLAALGRHEEALSAFCESEDIARGIHDGDMVTRVLGCQAQSLRQLRRHDEAAQRNEEAVAVALETANLTRALLLLDQQGDILREAGRFEESFQALCRGEQICRDYGRQRDLKLCLYRQMKTLRLLNRHDDLLAVAKEYTDLDRRFGGDGMYGLQCQSDALQAVGRLDKALSAQRERERLASASGDITILASTLGSQQRILQDLHREEDALIVCRRWTEIAWNNRNLAGFAEALQCEVKLLQRLQGPQAALIAIDEAQALLQTQDAEEELASLTQLRDDVRRSIPGKDQPTPSGEPETSGPLVGSLTPVQRLLAQVEGLHQDGQDREAAEVVLQAIQREHILGDGGSAMPDEEPDPAPYLPEAESDARDRLQRLLWEVGESLLAVLDTDRTVDILRAAQQVGESLQATASDHPTWRNCLAVSKDRLARAYSARRELGQALAVAEEARSTWEELVAEYPNWILVTRNLGVVQRFIADTQWSLGDQESAIETLRARRQTAQRLRALTPAETQTRIELIDIHLHLGGRLTQQGKVEMALGEYRMALPVAKQLGAEEPGNVERQRQLALIWLRQAEAFRVSQRHEEALDAGVKSQAIHERLLQQQPTNADLQRDLACDFLTNGDVLAADGRTADALAAYERCRQLCQTLADADPANRDNRVELVIVLERIAQCQVVAQENGFGLASCRLMLSVAERLVREQPNTPWLQRNLSIGLWRFAEALLAAGDREGAIEPLRSCVAIRRQLTQESPTDEDAIRDLIDVCDRLPKLLRELGRFESALAELREDLVLAQRLCREQPQTPECWVLLIGVHGTMGEIFEATHQTEELLVAYAESAEACKRLMDLAPAYAAAPRMQSDVYFRWGGALSASGRDDQALDVLRQAVQFCSNVAHEQVFHQERLVSLAKQLRRIGDALAQQALDERARQAYESSLEAARCLVRISPQCVDWQSLSAECHAHMGQILLQLGELAEGLDHYRTAVEIVETLVARDPRASQWRASLAFFHLWSADGYLKLDRMRAAMHACQAALALYRALADENPQDTRAQGNVAHAVFWVGKIMANIGRSHEAVEALREAILLREAIVAGDNEDTASNGRLADYHMEIVDPLLALGDLTAAVSALLEAAKLRQALAANSPEYAQPLSQVQIRLFEVGHKAQESGDESLAMTAFQASLETAQVLVSRTTGRTGVAQPAFGQSRGTRRRGPEPGRHRSIARVIYPGSGNPFATGQGAPGRRALASQSGLLPTRSWAMRCGPVVTPRRRSSPSAEGCRSSKILPDGCPTGGYRWRIWSTLIGRSGRCLAKRNCWKPP